MARVFDKRISNVEQQVAREKVTRPISWQICDPYVEEESGDVGINVYYYIHCGTKNERGKEGQVEFFFERDEITPTLKAVDSLDPFLRVQELGKISDIRDKEFNHLNGILCEAYDKSDKTDRSEIYAEVEKMLFKDEGCHEIFRSLVKIEGLMNLLKRPSVFYSEELRELFA